MQIALRISVSYCWCRLFLLEESLGFFDVLKLEWPIDNSRD